MASEYELEADARKIGQGWLFDRFRGWAEEYEVPIGELVRERNKLQAERDATREGLKAARAGLLREGLEVERLKALCGEAADEVVKVPGLIGLWKRLRAAKGET